MTILQLEYAVECARRQSINKAAASLFVSASNMSKAILALEGELGFPIFARTPGGIRPTPKGEVFLQHARSVVSELGRIEKLRDLGAALRFYVVGVPFSPLNRAFGRLTERYQGTEGLDLRLELDGTEQAVDRLSNARDHLAVVSVSTEAEAAFRAHLKRKRIASRELLRTPLAVFLRRDHPIFRQADPGSPAFWEALGQYPFLSDHRRERTFFPLVSNAVYNRLLSRCSQTVLVSDRGWKNDLLATTDCFTYGVHLPEDRRSGPFVSVPTDLSTFLILALWIDKGDMYPLTGEYLELLREEIDRPKRDP